MPSGEFTKKGCASCADADPAVGYLTCPIPVCPVRKGRYVSKIHVDELPADLHTEAPQILLSSSSMLPLSGLSCKSILGRPVPNDRGRSQERRTQMLNSTDVAYRLASFSAAAACSPGETDANVYGLSHEATAGQGED